MKSDIELMKGALEKFQNEAEGKFLAGIREHNPDGSKGLSRMHILQKITALQEELIDAWYYCYSIEQDLIGFRDEDN